MNCPALLPPPACLKRWLGAVAAALLALAAAGCGKAPAAAAPANAAQVQAVYAACMDEMLRSACQVANDKSPPKPSADAVFVAGVGRIDRVQYDALREAGDAMCTLTKKNCERDWEGASCRTARSLWSR